MEITFDATYSPEDNKLRIFASSRLDPDLYARFKEMGFKWAPKQELFVAPTWTPAREDFCLELAETIEPEQSTMIERAEAKAERLDNLAQKRETDSNAYAAAADRISQRFTGGQPILVGHHSERKARKDQKQMHSNMDKAIKCQKAVSYWLYKAEGVERHANRKANPGVRIRRIKTLLADLRDRQRNINHAHRVKSLWEKISAEENEDLFKKMVSYYVGGRLNTGATAPNSLYDDLRNEKITHKEAVEEALEWSNKLINSPYNYRWVAHILNRLGFERSELGPVEKFAGELTITIVQGFARTQGTHGPATSKQYNNEGDFTGYLLQSSVPLPAHLGEGKNLKLDSNGWIDLMQSVGYEVAAPLPAKPPILNFEAENLNSNMYGRINSYPQKVMTKADYKKICNDYKGVRLSTCGQFRFRTAMVERTSLVSVFLTDSKIHTAPQSEAINRVFQEV